LRILLVNPPLSDSAGPYPAICYLAGFLDTIGYRAELADASLEVLLRLFSARGVGEIARDVRARGGHAASDRMVETFLAQAGRYADVVETAVACLQGRDQDAIARASDPEYFPVSAATWARTVSVSVRARRGVDEARVRAAGVLEDLCRVIRTAVDPDFEIDAYLGQLSAGLATFAPIASRLAADPNVIDRLTDEVAHEILEQHHPDVIALSVPFAGNVYGAVRMAAAVKRRAPHARVVLGGGYVNTELRDLTDPGLFDYVDFVTLDDGERPLQCVIEMIEGRRPAAALLRTFRRVGGRVEYVNGAVERDVPFAQTGVPTYRGLPLERYFGFRPPLLPFPRLFGRRWNKLTLAHGCYWKRCTFCDTALDYIGRYEPASVELTIERIKRLRDETGESGFHFVDEAMPPALMKKLAERLIAERLNVAWWGNVRFDRALAAMAPVLAESGCIGLTGGLEAATDRTLALIDKGVSLAQAAQVCHALAQSGIHTHAYLIYGFPTETEQESVDALEFVRQMFEAGCLSSAFWHRFELTAWSPIAADPRAFGITVAPQAKRAFSNYLLDYDEPGGADHGRFTHGLRRAVEDFMLGNGVDRPAHAWFDFAAPAASLAPDFVRRAVAR
jgi:radical SAM superfamily enzyme YgiQ (UPF0313 family)